MTTEAKPSRIEWRRRLFDLLEEAEAKGPDDRRAWLASLHDEPAEVRSALEALLAQSSSLSTGPAVVASRVGDAAKATKADADVTRLRADPPAEPGLQTSDEPAAPAPGPTVGAVLSERFELLEELGRGGMGQVFKARDLVIARFERDPIVALKLLSDDFKAHPDSLIALQRETKRARSLAHPNVVTVHQFNVDGPLAYMTMEYLEGAPLDVYLRSKLAGGAPLQQAYPIMQAVGAALEYGHGKGIVHSDLKPANIFVCANGTVKVLDFGISRPMAAPDAREETLFDPAKRLGGLTPAYASLEMWNREPPDPRDDIYALACVSYELLAGRHPFGQASARQALEGNLAPQRLDGLNREQWDVLRRGLALRRADRIASVGAFLKPFAPTTWVRRYRLALLALGLVTGIGALTAGATYFRSYVEDDVYQDISGPQAVTQRRTLTTEEKKSVEDSLWLANDYLAAASPTMLPEDLAYVLSDGANAVAPIVNLVLKTDPGNKQALEIKRKIVSLYEARARTLQQGGQARDAIFLIRHGLDVRPNHRGLLRMQREICTADASVCSDIASTE